MAWYDFPIGRSHDPADNANGGELGIDLSTPVNTPITTPFAGVVSYADFSNSTGGIVKVITQQNGKPFGEYFLHLNALAVHAGDTVSPGQLVGVSGGTQPGAGGWPHVEYGLFQDLSVANEYWGFDTGSTADPTPLIGWLRSNGIPRGGGSALSSIPGVGTILGSAAPGVGQVSQSNILAGNLNNLLATTSANWNKYLWMFGLIALGGLLILTGLIVAILPNRQQAAQVGGIVGAVA